MLFRSTRRESLPETFSEAMERGLATDGGLYVPEHLPRLRDSALPGAESVAGTARVLLAPFFVGDPLAAALDAICGHAMNFPIPLTELGDGPAAVLELYWGPTAAFKDVGARFMGECLTYTERSRTVLVATSGDTGGAVAAALWRRPGIQVGVLFPRDGVSDLQRQQLTCWGNNVHALSVRGTFDDCQRILKAAFADPAWRARRHLTTANSINVARLLPQAMYYAWAALRYRERYDVAPGFVIPSGNVGNATACLWAKAMGLPIGTVVMVSNDNRTVPEFFASGDWRPRPSVQTLANAMDVGDPSNMERVFDLFPDREELRSEVRSLGVSDGEIQTVIRDGVAKYGRVWDPHTATAVRALEQQSGEHWIVVATAHPAKFRSVVEPLVGQEIQLPPALAELMTRPSESVEIEAELPALTRAME